MPSQSQFTMSQLACLLEWIDAHNGAVTAIATIFIALFTIVLAWVSWRQARLIGRQIELAREEFRATHRPKLVIRACKIRLKENAGDHMVPCQMTFHNEGVSPAYIQEIGTRVWEWDYPWTGGAQEIHFKTEQRADVLRSGEDMTFWTGKDFNTDKSLTRIDGGRRRMP